MDPYLPVYQVRTLHEQVSASLWSVRLSALLCALFGAFALFLSALGIYSVLSQVVTQRTHEIGVRMAIGAQRSDVFRLVIRQSLQLTLIGVAVGLAAAFGLARTLSGFLIGVGPSDPLTFVAIALLLTAVAWLAAYLPARRAVRVSPVVALRAE
jgi:putative ABC transport system permease protein